MDQLSWNEQRKLNKAHAKKLTKEEKAQLKEVEVRSKKRKLKKEFETQKQAAFEESLTAKLRSLDKKKAEQVFKEEGKVLKKIPKEERERNFRQKKYDAWAKGDKFESQMIDRYGKYEDKLPEGSEFKKHRHSSSSSSSSDPKKKKKKKPKEFDGSKYAPPKPSELLRTTSTPAISSAHGFDRSQHVEGDNEELDLDSEFGELVQTKTKLSRSASAIFSSTSSYSSRPIAQDISNHYVTIYYENVCLMWPISDVTVANLEARFSVKRPTLELVGAVEGTPRIKPDPTNHYPISNQCCYIVHGKDVETMANSRHRGKMSKQARDAFLAPIIKDSSNPDAVSLTSESSSSSSSSSSSAEPKKKKKKKKKPLTPGDMKILNFLTESRFTYKKRVNEAGEPRGDGAFVHVYSLDFTEEFRFRFSELSGPRLQKEESMKVNMMFEGNFTIVETGTRLKLTVDKFAKIKGVVITPEKTAQRDTCQALIGLLILPGNGTIISSSDYSVIFK